MRSTKNFFIIIFFALRIIKMRKKIPKRMAWHEALGDEKDKHIFFVKKYNFFLKNMPFVIEIGSGAEIGIKF